MPSQNRNDFEKYDSGNHRKTSTGILSSYKKQLNLSAQDLMEKDYWTKIRGARDKLKETLDKTDRDTFTKKFI